MLIKTFAAAISIALLAGCPGTMQNLAIGTTSQVLLRAQPALKAEADYELAAAAIPATLKTVEGFWNAEPDKAAVLTPVLAEGFCQYGTAFVDDEWERAVLAKDLERVDELDDRATKIYTRCLNYALRILGTRWNGLFGTTEQVNALIARPVKSTKARDAMMWAAYAMGSIINHNLDDIEIIAYLPTVKELFKRILAVDASAKLAKHKDGTPNCSGYENADRCVKAALPHVAMGMLYTGTGKQTGGDPDLATTHFNTAIALTGGKMLLPKVLYGYRVGVITGDKALFRKALLEVLATDPAIWPEQRLANEVAHRRARRYLKHEKELF